MKIGIQPLLPTGNYLNKRYSIEQDFPDDSHPADNFKYLHELVIAIHMSEYPLLYKDGKPLYSNFSSYKGEEEPVIQKRVAATEPASTEAGIIASIYTCTELKVLESYKMIAKKYPAIQAAYDQQLQKITA